MLDATRDAIHVLLDHPTGEDGMLSRQVNLHDAPRSRTYSCREIMGVPSAALRPPVVLLIDGDADGREMYAYCLRAANLQLIELDNTSAALAHAAVADAIVTGIRVPGPFDGVELVRRLRADDRTRRKPIIVMTASALDGERYLARAAGCNVFLTQPCLPDTLVSELQRLLARDSDGDGS